MSSLPDTFDSPSASHVSAASATPLHKLLAAAKQSNSGRPPVWFMRQAGRYLPQYRAVRQPAVVHELLRRLTIVVGDFLIAQARAGAQIVQLFDSWASALGPREYAEFALPYASQIVQRVRREAGVPVIMFAPGAGASLAAMTRATGADVIGIDWQTSPHVARDLAAAHGVATQGNLDPCALFGTPDDVRARTLRMLRDMYSPGYIANLGHGVLPDTPVENAKAFVDTVKEFTPGTDAPTG